MILEMLLLYKDRSRQRNNIPVLIIELHVLT